MIDVYYDNIIIGGGIAGLLMAYELEQMGQKFILFEKNDYLAGRMKWAYFHDVRVTLGAGVIREHDSDLIELCNKLGLELKSSKFSYALHPSIYTNQKEIDNIVEYIIKVYQEHKNNLDLMNFRTFMDLYFPVEFTAKFKELVIYNDGWLEDVHNIINDYPLREMLPRTDKNFSIDGGWEKLIKTVIEKIKNKDNLKINEEVIEIDWPNKKIMTSKGKYSTKRLFICTNIEITNAKLNLPNDILKTLKIIGSVPFLRVYTYHPYGLEWISYRVPGPLQKIIPMGKKVCMSAYTDSFNAEQVRDILERLNGQDAIDSMNKLIKNAFAGTSMKDSWCTDYIYHYWQHGVHYFKPHNEEIITSRDNVYLVGEMTSKYQGWSQGAINSVNQTLKLLKKNN